MFIEVGVGDKMYYFIDIVFYDGEEIFWYVGGNGVFYVNSGGGIIIVK